MSWYSIPTTFASCCVLLLLSSLPAIYTFTPHSAIHCTPTQTSTISPRISSLTAKRKRDRDKNNDITSSWYDNVDEGATPDDVFWEEMERQRSLAGIVPEVGGDGEFGAGAGVPMDPLSAIASNANGGGGGGKASNQQIQQLQSQQQEASMPPKASPAWKDSNANTGGVAGGINTEKVLGSYSAFMVSDNWINESYKAEHEESLEMEGMSLNDQLDEWSQESDDDDDDDEFDPATSAEPWDFWRADGEIVERDEDGDEIIKRIDMDKATKSEKAKEYLIDADTFATDEEAKQELADEEARYLENLSSIKVKSARLENARQNPKAKAFFSREPNALEGFDVMWVSAIDNACLSNLNGCFRNYGVEFAVNFGDWEDGCEEDSLRTIEELASYKARKVYEVTGLPTIASQTSFAVEPGRKDDPSNTATRVVQSNRIQSGYRFGSVGNHVDYIVEALKPYSDPTRKTEFVSCLCFYDGEIELFEYGVLECDIHFCDSLRTYIPMSAAITGIAETLQLTFGFEFQGWLKKKIRETVGLERNNVSIKLRDTVLKHGKVLPNEIVDVSSFMDSMVDVNLMDDCAAELAKKFEASRPNKILTVATTGLVIAIPLAKYLQIPVVYARKERNIVMSDTWQANYSSKTIGQNRELLVSKKHIHEDDRILVVDDFLSGGSSQEALLRIINDAGAKAVGVGVVLEKAYDVGRKALSGYDIPVESLVKIASVAGGIITLKEEDGYIEN